MERLKKIFTNNYKILIGIIIGLIISISCVYAATETLIDSEEVKYDNKTSHGGYTDVQESIDELYKRAGYTEAEWKDPILQGADPVLNDKLILQEIQLDSLEKSLRKKLNLLKK